jgi:hypothetical protein
VSRHGRSLLALLLLPAIAWGQTTPPAEEPEVTCPAGLSEAGGRVCTAALDGITMLHPSAALLMNGGNPRLGSAGVLGQFGRLALGVRATTVQVVSPSLAFSGVADTVPVDRKVQFYAPRLDLQVGVLQKQMPMGRVGVDVLLSALVMPRNGTDLFTPVPGSRTIRDAAVSLDWGVRFGIEGPKLPVASLTIMKRSTPRVTMGQLAAGDNIAYTFNASAISTRLMLGKRFGTFELAAGAGADLLGGKAEVIYRNIGPDTLAAPLAPSLSGVRLVTALNLGFHLGPVQVVGEGGYMVGSSLALATRFAENDTDAGKFFGGIGIVLSR